ncbi:MAG TPA: hypothetical protein VGF79_05535 [Bacteroidia bacterium]
MRSKIFYITVLVALAFTGTSDVANYRKLYLESVEKPASAETLLSSTQSATEAIGKAYCGAAWALKAKHGNNPIKKLEHLKTGLTKLNDAVVSDAINVEIRFLRFSVEENIPSLVSFTSHIDDDKKMIIGALLPSHPFYSTIKSYMLKSKKLNASEKGKIR